MKEKVVLAYSGGLDTSCCIKWLMEEKDLDVICVIGDVGQEKKDLNYVCEKALKVGAIAAEAIDMKEEYVNEYLTKALAANCMYENKYPMVSALSRPIIAKHLVDACHRYGAKYVAHGCTGKGNDQVRFEVAITSLDPDLQVLAPVREWDLLTRPQEMEWAEAHGVPVPTTKGSPYFIDDNLWGRAIECGVLEDPWNEPPADIYSLTVDPQQCPDEPEVAVIGFTAGVPSSVNGEPMSFIDCIWKMNEIAGRNGYGRVDMIENRLVGVKSRECYEVPGALAIITAHRELEDLCLSRDVLHYKPQIEQEWARLVYNGLWFSPLKNALDAFNASTQTMVTGEVRLKFYKGSCTVVGRKSPNSLYDFGLATYDSGDTFDRDSAKGFIDLHGLPTRTWAKQRKDAGAEGVI